MRLFWNLFGEDRESRIVNVVMFLGVALLIAGIVYIGLSLRITDTSANQCHDTTFTNDRSVECLDQRVQECIALDRYTEDQCIALVGGGK